MISPDASILSIAGKRPSIHPSAFVAAGARIIGDVTIGANASIWYNCVLRGDINRIVVGERSNLQDGTVVHVEGAAASGRDLPTRIAADVLIGHMAILHGCIVETGAFIGMGAIVMDGGQVKAGAMLGAGAMLTPGKVVPDRELWTGRPACFRRLLNEAERRSMRDGVTHYVENALRHATAGIVQAPLRY